jgi:hypothetical protein
MSNPIEQARLKREAVWAKQRAREERKKPRDFGGVEERVVAEKKAKAEAEKRANNGLPLGAIQRDVVIFLRKAHRAVSLETIQQRVVYPADRHAELLSSLKVHPRIRIRKDGMYEYKARYEVNNIEEMRALIESATEGVIANELFESYHEAKGDIETLKRKNEVFAINNRVLGSDVLFGCAKEFDIPMPQSLKDKWNSVSIPDPKSLEATLQKMNLPVAIHSAPVKTKIVRKRQKKSGSSSGRQVKDHYNDHVPSIYLNDSWKETLSIESQMYGKH